MNETGPSNTEWLQDCFLKLRAVSRCLGCVTPDSSISAHVLAIVSRDTDAALESIEAILAGTDSLPDESEPDVEPGPFTDESKPFSCIEANVDLATDIFHAGRQLRCGEITDLLNKSECTADGFPLVMAEPTTPLYCVECGNPVVLLDKAEFAGNWAECKTCRLVFPDGTETDAMLGAESISTRSKNEQDIAF